MKIAIAQISTRPGDIEGALDAVARMSEKAAADGVELLVFPFACVSGAAVLDPGEQEGFMLDLASGLARTLERIACPTILPVVFDFEGMVVNEIGRAHV